MCINSYPQLIGHVGYSWEHLFQLRIYLYDLNARRTCSKSEETKIIGTCMWVISSTEIKFDKKAYVQLHD